MGDLGRGTSIEDVEAAIASRWWRKDPELQIQGLKKLYLGSFAGFEVFRVDSEWLRDNLDTTFGTGGHGLVHTFIPLVEIWIDDVNEPWPEIVLHEAVEFHYMLENNDDYKTAHPKAVKAEASTPVTENNLEAAILAYCPERKGQSSYVQV